MRDSLLPTLFFPDPLIPIVPKSHSTFMSFRHIKPFLLHFLKHCSLLQHNVTNKIHETSDTACFLAFIDLNKTIKCILLIYRFCNRQICSVQINLNLDFSHKPSKTSGNRMLSADE